MSNEDFVSFEQSKRLKTLGFKQSISNRFWYLNDGNIAEISPIADATYRENVCCSMPTLSQACKWLRSKGWAVQMYLNGVRTAYFARVWKMEMNSDVVDVAGQYETYEQAQSAGIDVALGLLEKGGGQ